MSGPSTSQPSFTPPPRPQGLLVASTLCWLWGILMGLSGIAFLIPALGMQVLGGAAIVFGLGFCVLGGAYCVAGYLVRQMRLIGGWIAVVIAGLLSLLQLVGGATRAAGVGLIMNLAIVVLVVMNWRHLRPSSRQVGA